MHRDGDAEHQRDRSWLSAPCRRLAWQASPDLELGLLAQELGRRHVEFDPASASRFGPTAFLKLDGRPRS